MIQKKLMEWLSSRKLWVEGLLAALALSCYLLMVADIDGGTDAFMVTMSLLAVFYFMTAYMPSEVRAILPLFGIKLISISSSICIIGLQFFIINLRGGDTMLQIALLPLCAASVMLIVHWIKTNEAHYFPLIVRGAILAILSGYAMAVA